MPTLSIPDATYRQLKSLATERHTTVDELAALLLAEDSLLNLDYLDERAAETPPVPTMAEVLAITAKLHGRDWICQTMSGISPPVEVITPLTARDVAEQARHHKANG